MKPTSEKWPKHSIHSVGWESCGIPKTWMHSQSIMGYLLLVTKMADGPAGFHFDELNKVRVLEPEISQQTQELKEECKEFVDSKSGCFMKEILGAKLTFCPLF